MLHTLALIFTVVWVVGAVIGALVALVTLWPTALLWILLVVGSLVLYGIGYAMGGFREQE